MFNFKIIDSIIEKCLFNAETTKIKRKQEVKRHFTRRFYFLLDVVAAATEEDAVGVGIRVKTDGDLCLRAVSTMRE